MFRDILKGLILSLMFVFSTSIFAFDYAKLPEIVKKNITKQYSGENIKILSVTKMGGKFKIIIKTEDEQDIVIVTKQGKILSISASLMGLETEGGC